MEEDNECQYRNVSWLVRQENIVRNGHRSVIGKVYMLFGNVTLDAAGQMFLEAATRVATVFVSFQISLCSAEKSG